MDEDKERINQLLEKLNTLSKRQEIFQGEIFQLRVELNNLLKNGPAPIKTEEPKTFIAPPKREVIIEDEVERSRQLQKIATQQYQQPVARKQSKPLIDKENLEKFIGENLINKIGIVITVIGVAIGSKYAIDHQMISPLTRIILGYLVGVGLLGFAIRLKKQYENFSAVLLSGAIAILYLITFAAYSYYSLVPQAVAFGLMVLFTGFAVIAAINYNKQIIAHIGLVGAYAVPFLLSDGSGKVVILFSYMAIINTGILAIAVQRYWKPLYYSSFALTWLIYASWYVTKYSMPVHFRLALIFLAIFFIIFYLTFLTYKLFKKEKFGPQDVMLYLLNSFIFYGLGYASLSDHPTGKQLLGLFTLANAVVHFAASVAIYRNKLADRNLFYLVSGLVLVFITIAIPVQLDGNWVTLLWAGEAAILFWIGRTRKVTFYEMLSYPLMLLALFSILQDWTSVYNTYTPGNIASKITPFININFMSSVLFVAAFGFMTWTNVKNKIISAADSKNEFLSKASYLAPAILLMVLFGAFATEISCYWQQRYIDSVFSMTQAGAKGYAYHQGDEDLKKFQAIWLINYSLLFFTLLSFINIKKIKSEYLGYINLLLNVGAIAAFLVIGLFTLSELRDTYISQSLAQYFDRGVSHMVIRYISLGFVAALVFACYQYIKQEFIKLDLKIGFDVLFYTTVLWIASSELIGWMSLYRSQQSYKLGLSILWGIYSLLLIGLGIWKRKKHLRIGAIVLFAITLVKLFFYDIADLDTIAKTIVFVSLGVLLLIISFLYNKYKNIITDETQS